MTEPGRQPLLSVVVPAYNEERGISDTVAALVSFLERSGSSWELIVVDNASSDETRERVLAFDRPEVRLLVNPENRGKGYSVRRGMLEAKGKLRLHCDADCAGCLPYLPRMIELSERFDVVVGSRLVHGSYVGRRQPLTRRIAGRSFIALCRIALSEPTRDLFCGFKLWRSHAATETFSRIRIDGWVFDAEALAMARALGHSVVETGISWSDREGSRLSMTRVLVPVLRELLAARGHVRREGARARSTPAVDATAAVAAEQHS